jgi:Ca-activated chloride channel family protein
MKRSVFVATLFLLGLTLSAQTPVNLRVDVQLVNVVATVTDAAGRHVPNLTQDDFTLFEDGVPQKISHFSQDYNVPVSVGILLDISGSMQEKMKAATAAVERFINNVHPDDDIFLMTFARDIKLEQDFTSDRRKLSQALNKIRVSGGTVLYDALAQGLEKVQTGRHKKRAILVMSDGMDASSKKIKMPALVNRIQESEVLVYGLGTAPTVYADPAEHVPFRLPTVASAARGPVASGTPARARGNASGVNMAVMRQFADNSGGQAYLLAETFVDGDGSDIDNVLSSIADELRGQYTLGYYASSRGNAGKLHAIKVTAKEGMKVRARTNYQEK